MAINWKKRDDKIEFIDFLSKKKILTRSNVKDFFGDSESNVNKFLNDLEQQSMIEIAKKVDDPDSDTISIKNQINKKNFDDLY